ncbi:ATP-binding protein, partial [Arcobacteraceae bacterium]|nr:ATP-binding protein [Arcobacteraceae bacterium]
GYIAFALDHRHIMEFTDSLDPHAENTKQDIADAGSGNYAFMWDNKGRNISHARDYFIVGYDKQTGEQVPGWISLDIANKFNKSQEKNLNTFLKNYPQFQEQSLKKKPNITQLTNKGEVGLDCRYLNFAPQCQGWMDLTKEGSYGSFVIFWSGVWKLTTAAAIPYYTGQYGETKRGFGFVTIGANVDEFHLAANKTKKNIDTILDKQVQIMKQELDENKFNIMNYINSLTNELIIVTFLMLVIVIAIAIWMSNIVTNKIKNLLNGTQAYSKHHFDYRINVTSKDEIGELEHSFNDMADEIKELIDVQLNTNALLDIKVKEANAASKAKSDFLASMSHEIRTPLNAILGFIGILKAQENNNSNLEYYSIIETSGENLIKIINDILDFSKIESDNIQLDTIKVNLYSELKTIIKQFTQNTNKKALTFNVHISEKLSKDVLIDLLKLTQVLNNLISNAIKFSNNNGNITIEMSHTKNNNLFVSVENDGIEIAKEKQAIIFDAFTQEDNTTTRKFGGTGLGLTISKKLIEFMHGELKLDTLKQNGAKFYFEIPLNIIHTQDTKETILIEQNMIESINTDISILVVEDNPANQMYMKVLMKKLSLKFELANNGIEAVELYKTKEFDLILMDENMPEMSGSEATIEIRKIEQKTKKHIPIIALTANALKGDKERFLQVGMDDYLQKPINISSIKNIISKYNSLTINKGL